VTFRIDEAIRCVRKCQSLQISEWGWLWQAGEEYRAAEHILLFLDPRKQAGLDEPYGRSDGALVHSE